MAATAELSVASDAQRSASRHRQPMVAGITNCGQGKGRSGWRLGCWLLVICLWGVTGQRLQAATITVKNPHDRGAGSLRQALVDATAGDTIRFDPALSGATIGLTGGRLTVTKTVTIDASTLPVAVTLSGTTTTGQLSVSAGVAVTLTGMIFANGNGSYGGAIYNAGTLTLHRVTLATNTALSGGAIYNVGTLNLLNSTLSGNRAYSGGGIDNYGPLTIKNSTLRGNHANLTGGGLFNAGTLYLYNTILADSSSGGDCYTADESFFGLVGVIAANLHNLIEDASCNAARSGDPNLSALTLVNGALVHELAAASPALDAGDRATCLTVDQLGVARPQGSGCDLGAVELEVPVDRVGNITQQSFTALYQPTPQSCAGQTLDVHTITPILSNNQANESYHDLYFVVTALGYTTPQIVNSVAYTPTLCNADGTATQTSLGGVGARVTATLAGDLADGLLGPTETFRQIFQVGLPVRARYRLFVNLYGQPTMAIAGNRAAGNTNPDPLLGTLGWEFDAYGNLVGSTVYLFLPLITQD